MHASKQQVSLLNLIFSSYSHCYRSCDCIHWFDCIILFPSIAQTFSYLRSNSENFKISLRRPNEKEESCCLWKINNQGKCSIHSKQPFAGNTNTGEL